PSGTSATRPCPTAARPCPSRPATSASPRPGCSSRQPPDREPHRGPASAGPRSRPGGRSGAAASAPVGPGATVGPVTTAVPPLRTALRAKSPSLAVERELWEDGADVVVGVDEVGRGAWAGPLVVGAAVVPRDRRIYKIRDSKMLTEP